MTRIGPYVWGADPGLVSTVLDPYSHWMLTYGQDFDFAANQLKEDADDFSYLALINETAYDLHLENNQLVLQLVPGDPTLPQELIDDIFALIEANWLHLLRVPLRRRSLPPSEPVSQEPINLESVIQSVQQISEDGANDRVFGDEDWTRPQYLDPGQTVVVAVIDDAMNIAHHRFRSEQGASRVDFAWIQDGVAVTESKVPFGRELTREQIEQAIHDDGSDEEALLADLGLVDFTRTGHNPLALRASHGTHVLDLAAGSEPDDAGAVDRRIITVSLPSLVTFETSGALLGAFSLWGLQYILKRTRAIASELGTPVPVVINFSYGLAGGPHDRNHFVETAIEALLNNHRARDDGGGPVQIVLPSGNANLERGHASKAANTNNQIVSINLPWRLQPGDTTSSYLEIWLPADAENIDLRIGWPGSAGREGDDQQSEAQRQNLASGGPYLLWRLDDSRNGDSATIIARVTRESATPGGKQRILVAIAPTELLRSDRDPAPAGVWRVTVAARLPSRGSIEAWIQRDDSPIGSRLQGRQSYFDDPAYERLDAKGDIKDRDPPNGDSVVRRSGALNGIATGATPVVVGGYINGDAGRPPAPYSGTSAPEMRNPTLAATSERSRVHPGVLAAGSRNGSRVAINGTSVAVPQVTGRIAKAMQVGELQSGTLDEAQIRGILHEDDAPADHSSEEPDRIGVGRLDFFPLTGNIPDR